MWLESLSNDISTWADSMGRPAEMFMRLLLAAACGGLVGLEREIRGRKAGFRTNLLVSVGSAMAMIVSISLAEIAWRTTGGESTQIRVDPGRIAYGVMTGIGFLGAGTIIHHRGSIHGLTTAAALWCVAAIGLAAGLGMYVITVLASLLVLAVLWLLRITERLIPAQRLLAVTVREPWQPGCVSRTVERVRARGYRLTDLSFVRCEGGTHVDIRMRLSFPAIGARHQIERELGEREGLNLISLREIQL